MTADSHSPTWWGRFDVPADTTAYWQIGPLEIWLYRSSREWRIGTRNQAPGGKAPLVVNRNEGRGIPADDSIAWNRFGFRQTTGSIELLPVQASRPVVVSPDTAFILPRNEETSLYVSTPVSVRFEFGQTGANVFEQITQRLSDTWFGPSTMVGEFCYAIRTRARLQLADLDTSSQRLFSAIIIRNRANSELKVERIKLPMPNLSVFSAADGRLWTETVTLNRREDGDLAELQVDKSPPGDVAPARLLAGPRSKPEKGLMIRSFGGLFG